MFWRKKRVYLDRAAGVAGNPSSPHTEGQRAKERLERARTKIARLLEVQADDIVFTSGATEANALAILGLLKAGDHALYLPSSHASVVENMKLAATRGVVVEVLPIKDMRVDVGALAKLVRPETRLVSMDAVCGETGVIWNTREVAEALRGVAIPSEAEKGSARAARPIQHPFSAPLVRPFLHVDASQAPLTEKLTRAHFGADMLTLDLSKVAPARGIGLLVAHRTIPLSPLYAGGGQERGLRSGTESPELAEQFATALASTQDAREAFLARARSARATLVAQIEKLPNVLVLTARDQAPHILNLSFPGRDTDYLLALLDEEGFALSSRSACETDSEEGSRAVFALTGDREWAKATLRISWGPENTARDLRRFGEALSRALAFIDSTSSR